MLANKKALFENPHDPAEVDRIGEWSKTPEYREKNFAREALTVNPAKACQPLGAVFAALGVRAHTAVRPRLPGLRRVLSQPFVAALQGADFVRLLVHDGRRGCVRGSTT